MIVPVGTHRHKRTHAHVNRSSSIIGDSSFAREDSFVEESKNAAAVKESAAQSQAEEMAKKLQVIHKPSSLSLRACVYTYMHSSVYTHACMHV